MPRSLDLPVEVWSISEQDAEGGGPAVRVVVPRLRKVCSESVSRRDTGLAHTARYAAHHAERAAVVLVLRLELGRDGLGKHPALHLARGLQAPRQHVRGLGHKALVHPGQ